MFCLEGDQRHKADKDPTPEASGHLKQVQMSSCSVPFCVDTGQTLKDNEHSKMPSDCYRDFVPERTSSLSSKPLCCNQPAYNHVVQNCVVPTKCETAECLRSGDRGSCMMDNRSPYVTEYHPQVW
ncbi:IRO domain-containing protein [Caerostris extrusa]|uniref:IRO domain-containing protein n=1 Tax=Caerostris extrusa TaxID=172846 RepID=A0AAV4U4Q3_CAEEX|nr:IRO domain-containing protein [Caerostris extrusa]